MIARPRPRAMWLAVLAAGTVAATMAQAVADQPATAASESEEISMSPNASRPPPAEVPAIVHDGVRYQEDRSGLGGGLKAITADGGKVLWTLQVYEVKRPKAPADALPSYFASMKLARGGHALTIENEAGFRYEVDLKTHASKLVHSPKPGKTMLTPPPP